MEYYAKLLTFLGTAGGSIFLFQLFNRNKTSAETINLVGKTYSDVLDSLRKEVARLESKLNTQEKRIRELETEIDQLKNAA